MLRNLVNWASIVVVVMGAVWLPMEAYEGLTEQDVPVSYQAFLAFSLVIGTLFFLMDGYLLSGRLRKRICIRIPASNSPIEVTAGDLYKQDGWKVIPVNSTFDHRVDEVHISSRSLHGATIKRHWGKDWLKWQQDIMGVDSSLALNSDGLIEPVEIGRSIAINRGDDKYIFTALTIADTSTHITRSGASNITDAVRGALDRARECASNEPLCFPIMGTGLGRARMTDTQALCLIISEIISQASKDKVTSRIRIVVPSTQIIALDLSAIQRIWR